MYSQPKTKKKADKNSNEREKWSRKVEYLLSLIGYLVGLGNLWRFPYICMRNGGGAFLIPFVFFLVCCGIPLFFLESAIGQFSGKGLLHVWEVCPIFRGIGVGMMIPLLVLNVYYNMIIAWTIYYIGNSFISPLPWTTCSNEWNSPNCIADRNIVHNISTDENRHVANKSQNSKYLVLNNTERISKYEELHISSNFSLWVTGQEDFWQQNVLQYSGGIEELGHINWHLVLCLIGAWVIVGLCIMKGVKSVGKVVYVTATLPYILLTVILIRGLTLDGSINGVILYLRPNFKRLLDIHVWTEAALQVFYSLGPGWGTIITLSSFNKFKNNCIRDSVVLSLLGEGTSLYSGLVIFTVLGYMATKLSLPLDKIVKSGPGLGFIAYPEALTHLPGANIWSCLFFIMLLTVGLDSQFVCCETIVGALTDSFPSLRRRRLLFLIMYCIFNFLLGLVFCSQGGIYVFQLLDWYIAAFALPIFGFLECIIIAWIYGLERFSRDVKLMMGKDVPIFFRVCLRFVTPSILLGLIFACFIGYKRPTYGSYYYPDYAAGIGIFIAVLPLFPIPLYAVLEVKNTYGSTLIEKVKTSLRPTNKWIPANKDYEKVYCDKDYVESSDI